MVEEVNKQAEIKDLLHAANLLIWEAQQNRSANNEIIKLLKEAKYYVQPTKLVENQQVGNSPKHHENFQIVKPVGFQFTKESNIKRDIPRPEAFRQENYEELYDFKTLFYDAILTDDELILVAPRLFNFKTLVQAAKISLNGSELNKINIFENKRASRLHFDISGLSIDSNASLRIEIGKIDETLEINKSYNDLLTDEVILYATVFNNKLRWVKEWVEFYVNNHGATAIVLFDNGSTAFTPEELLATVKSVKGVKYAFVNSNSYKFGPLSIDRHSDYWDSDYYKIGTLEIMRWKYGQKARAAIQADIDELTITDSGETLVERMEKSEKKNIQYGGFAVPPVIDEIPNKEKEYSFGDFKYTYKEFHGTVFKWTLKPSVVTKKFMFGDHWAGSMENVKDVHIYHFYGVNNLNWGDDLQGRERTITQFLPGDEEKYEINLPLVEAVQKGIVD